MFTRHLTRSAMAAALALAGIGLAVPGPAHAAPSPVVDSFEGNPYERWTVDETPGMSLVYLGNHQRAQTGSNIAWLDAWPVSNTPARIHQTVTVDRPGVGPVTCYAEVYLMKATLGPRPAVQGVLRLRDGSGTGAILSTANVTISDDANWERFRFSSIPYRETPITVDISAFGGTILVDDVAVNCVRDPR